MNKQTADKIHLAAMKTFRERLIATARAIVLVLGIIFLMSAPLIFDLPRILIMFTSLIAGYALASCVEAFIENN